LDREYDALYRLTLGIVLSIAVTVFWSFLLNSFGVNGSTGLGYVVGPNIAGGLIGLSAAFFGLGWWRGAYPWMARLHPALGHGPRSSTEGRAHGVQARNRGALRPRAVAGQAGGPGRPRLRDGGLRREGTSPEMVRGMAGGGPEESRCEGRHPRRSPRPPEQG